MIKQYLLILLLTYIEYFTLWFFFEYKHRIIWDNIKFWLKYPPFICLFFYWIDDFFIGTMIYVTFSFPYLLIIYCIRNINRDFYDSNKILVSATLRYYSNKKNK